MKHIIIGLSNEHLKEYPCFNCDIYNLVVNFINRLAAPACFIAYNGNNYDYPIFLSEFKNIEKVYVVLYRNIILQIHE